MRSVELEDNKFYLYCLLYLLVLLALLLSTLFPVANGREPAHWLLFTIGFYVFVLPTLLFGAEVTRSFIKERKLSKEIDL